MVAERTYPCRGYAIRAEEGGDLVDMLTFREVQALIAAREGRVRVVLRRVYAPWFYDEHLEAVCDTYGIGRFTLSTLQRKAHSRGPLIESRDEPGQAGLTDLGRMVLDAVLSLDGTRALAGVSL